MAASEGETTMGRLGGRTGRRISNKSLYWFDADADWADDWYNNRIKHAVDAALEAKTVIKTVLSRALTRVVIPDEELREELSDLWTGWKLLQYGRRGYAAWKLI